MRGLGATSRELYALLAETTAHVPPGHADVAAGLTGIGRALRAMLEPLIQAEKAAGRARAVAMARAARDRAAEPRATEHDADAAAADTAGGAEEAPDGDDGVRDAAGLRAKAAQSRRRRKHRAARREARAPAAAAVQEGDAAAEAEADAGAPDALDDDADGQQGVVAGA